MLTPGNIFKAGYIFYLPSILAPSSPLTSKKLFEASSVEFLNLDDTHCGKRSNSKSRCIIKAGKHGIHWCQFELFWQYKITSHTPPSPSTPIESK